MEIVIVLLVVGLGIYILITESAMKVLRKEGFAVCDDRDELRLETYALQKKIAEMKIAVLEADSLEAKKLASHITEIDFASNLLKSIMSKYGNDGAEQEKDPWLG